jgi:DNA invertase Pin-like site-specific DNA recombinase
MTAAIYKRVSSKHQDTRAQSTDLDAWRQQAEAKGTTVVEYSDKFTGRSMDRPGWRRLWADVTAGKVDQIICWRLDRLGRTVSGLSALFEDLLQRKVGLVSLRDSIDLGTAAGRLMANVIASVASYESEIRGERQAAGIAAVRQKNGGRCPWGGREAGRPNRATREKVGTVRQLREQGTPIAEISRIVGLTRQTIHRLLRNGRTVS